MTQSPPAAWRGLIVYLLLTFGFSWIPAALLQRVWLGQSVPTPLRLLVSSLVYAVCMGWQPLVALWIVRRWVDRVNLDDVLGAARPRFYALAAVAPLVLAGLAMAIALMWPGSALYATESASESGQSSLGRLLLLVASAAAALTLLWIQALAEEVGWRGYFLARFMGELGPWPGLALHGAIWGLWYAPILLLASGDFAVSSLRSASFVLTCMFLGALLGWLRLASKSVVPTTLANSLLTVTAGLPFLLQGDDPGLRGAAYGPAGWLPMTVALGLLLATRFRQAVRTPEIEAVLPTTRIWLVILPEDDEPSRDDSQLH